MNVIIQSNKLTSDELVNLLDKLSEHFKYLIVSNWQDIHFVKFDPKHDTIPVSSSGRAFGEKAELRWRRDEDNKDFICRWIADCGTYPEIENWCPLKTEELNTLESSEKTGYLLWGELLRIDDEDFWYQARIPKKLKYPTDLASKWENKDDKTPLVLYVCEYKHNGRTMFERFIEFGRYGEEI